jgi:hypothetical protein
MKSIYISKSEPPKKKKIVFTPKGHEIKAASRKDLQLNREFPESYKSGVFSKGSVDETRHRAIYGAMDKIVRDNKALNNERQRGVSDKVHSAMNRKSEYIKRK